MFVENKEYEPFALEFKRCYKELITKLSEIWNEYDFEMSVGDSYAFPNYTKEEIEKKNNELNNKKRINISVAASRECLFF